MISPVQLLSEVLVSQTGHSHVSEFVYIKIFATPWLVRNDSRVRK